MRRNQRILLGILHNPEPANKRKENDMYTVALMEGAAMVDGQEKTALLYLANNPGAMIVLDCGDTVINNALTHAVERM